MAAASPATCSRPRNTACTRTPPRWCSSISAAIGIQAELELPDWATRVALGNRGQYRDRGDGHGGRQQRPRRPRGPDRRQSADVLRAQQNIDIPAIDKLLAAGRAEFDDAKRHAIYAEMQKLVLEQAPIVGLCWRSQGYAMTKDVQGLPNLPGALTFYSGDHARGDDDRLTPSGLAAASGLRGASAFRPAGLGRRDASCSWRSIWCPATRPSCCCPGRRRARSRGGRGAARRSSASTGRCWRNTSPIWARCCTAISASRCRTAAPVAPRSAAPAAHAGADRRRGDVRAAGRPAGRRCSRRSGAAAGSIARRGVRRLALAVPVFVIGTLLVLVFAQDLHWMPAGGYVAFADAPAAASAAAADAGADDRRLGWRRSVFRMTRARRAGCRDARLRAHRAREGAGAAPRAAAPRAAQRADAGGDGASRCISARCSAAPCWWNTCSTGPACPACWWTR